MPSATAKPSKPDAAARYDIAGLLGALGDVPVTTDTQRVRLRSRDYFWYSPVLNKQLHDGRFDMTVRVDETKRDIVVNRFDAVPHPM